MVLAGEPDAASFRFACHSDPRIAILVLSPYYSATPGRIFCACGFTIILDGNNIIVADNQRIRKRDNNCPVITEKGDLLSRNLQAADVKIFIKVDTYFTELFKCSEMYFYFSAKLPVTRIKNKVQIIKIYVIPCTVIIKLPDQ
jgi:hypothetical protein